MCVCFKTLGDLIGSLNSPRSTTPSATATGKGPKTCLLLQLLVEQQPAHLRSLTSSAEVSTVWRRYAGEAELLYMSWYTIHM